MMKCRLMSIILIICLAAAGSAAGDERAPKPIQTIPIEEIAPVQEGQHHYLLLCTDVWHGNPGNLGNTDGIVLVTLDTRAHRVMLTSFIRDALVWRPMDENPEEMGFGRINYIAKRLGPEALCRVISQHINVRVEDYLLFDFTQIANIVDYLGGVDIELNREEINYLRKYAVPDGSVRNVKTGTDLRAGATHRPGLYHFAGHSAVIYMRIRKAGGGGDFMRTQRARTVMSTLADKCREITWEEAEALVNNIMDNNTMTNINLEEMLNAARYAYSLRDCTIEELRIPPDGAASPITFASMAVQEIDWEACRSAMANYLKNSFLVVEDD
ncbi:MAG: LCP family protein [Clostridia bacterium]|nr:LCP family protein [Clostridia bacterium]MBR0386610.1 LCP family protein [Clostridia bacterium]MBR2602733.1 LCP family protein [Clostridia bacterium]MBR7174332.1 LCP family protein [Clostridia bacterium]